MSAQTHNRKKLQDQLEEAQSRFLNLLEEIPDLEMDRKWPGESWTIKEELVHIIQVVEVIQAGIETVSKGKKRSLLGLIPANLRGWVNGQVIIPQKAKNETRKTIARAYQDAHKILIDQLEKLGENDWEKGMPFPRKYRTIAQMANRPVEHFEEHETHIRTLLKMEIKKLDPA